MSDEKGYSGKSEAEYAAISLGKGSTFLFFGRFLFYLIGFIGFAIVARLIVSFYGNAEPLGWIYVAATIPSLISILGDFGVGYGITNKFIVNIRRNEKDKAMQYFWTGVFYSLFLNSLYSIAAFFLGYYIIIYIFQKPEVLFLLPIYSSGIMLSWFNGISWNLGILLDKTWINGIMLLISIITQYGFSIAFLILGFGIWGVAFAASILAPLLSGCFGILFSYRYIDFKMPNLDVLKDSLKFGFPVYAGNLIGSIQSNTFNALLSRFASSLEIAYFSVAQRLSPLIDVITYPFNTLMFPTFSRIDSKGNVVSFFNEAVKINAILSFIVPMLILSMPKNLLTLFFGQSYSSAYIYLILLAIIWIKSSLGGYIMASLLMGQGKTKFVFNITVLGSLTALASGFVLIPLYSVIGYLISTMIAFWPSFILSLRYVKKEFIADYPYSEVIKCFGVASISALISFLIVEYTPSGNTFKTILAGVFGFLVYFYLIKKLKLVSDLEYDLLEKSFKNIPYIGNLLLKILKIYTKL